MESKKTTQPYRVAEKEVINKIFSKTTIIFVFVALFFSCTERPRSMQKSISTNFEDINLPISLQRNGSSPINQIEYRKYFKIKSYKEIVLNTGKSIIIAGLETDTVINKQKAIINEHQEYDRQGNITKDYQFLAEGPLIYKYRYQYNSLNQITQKQEVGILFETPTETYHYTGATLDSIIYSTIQHSDSSKHINGIRYFTDTTEIFLYQNLETSVFDTVKPGPDNYTNIFDSTATLIEQQRHQNSTKYIYNNCLRVATNYEKGKKTNSVEYIYNKSGLLTKKVYHNKTDTEHLIFYTFHE